MCVNKISVLDLLHGCRQYFACGRCASCRQAAADRRSRKIRAHHKSGMFCYFITLTYFNGAQPYIKISDLNDIYDEYCLGYNTSDNFRLPIYRDISIIKTGRKEKGVYKKTPCSILNFKELPYTSLKLDLDPVQNRLNFEALLDSFQPIRYFINKKAYYDFDKISIAYHADAKNFFKRLRQNLFRHYKKRIPLEYFYSPEYGPTTQRFHIHALVWLPTYISTSEVKNFIAEAWPFASTYRTRKYVQNAKDPANYLSAYVNSSSNVSEFLTENFKLRTSHSLDFGFNDELFGFQKVYENVRKGCFTYVGVITAKNGSPTLANLPYPRYILHKYFPIFKGFGRLTKSTIINILEDPAKYFALTPTPTRIREDGTSYYQSNIIDSIGFSVTFTRYEAKHAICCIERSYKYYFLPLGISRIDFAEQVYACWNDYFTFLYINSLQGKTPFEQARTFYNLSDLVSSTYRVRNLSLSPIVENLTDSELDCNKFPEEIYYTQQKIEKFNRNIKQRKINQLEI